MHGKEDCVHVNYSFRLQPLPKFFYNGLLPFTHVIYESDSLSLSLCSTSTKMLTKLYLSYKATIVLAALLVGTT
jgi:hypothetical protein